MDYEETEYCKDDKALYVPTVSDVFSVFVFVYYSTKGSHKSLTLT